MCILQNQCSHRLLKYKESSRITTKFDYWKCNRMYEKEELRSDFRKNISLAGAWTHESDYFHGVHYLGCKAVTVNSF